MQNQTQLIFDAVPADQSYTGPVQSLYDLLTGSIIATLAGVTGDVNILFGYQLSNYPPPSGKSLQNGWVPPENSWIDFSEFTGVTATDNGTYILSLAGIAESFLNIRTKVVHTSGSGGTLTLASNLNGND